MTKDDNNDNEDAVQKHQELMAKMEAARKEWKKDGDEEIDDTDRLLNDAIEMAIEQGKGWSPGEKEEYMKKILDDDFIPPIFASTQEELEKSGLAEAFSTLNYDDSPEIVALEMKQKGTDAFMNGKRNQVNNVQYYRDAINHYYQAIAWAQKIEPIENQQQQQQSQTKNNDNDNNRNQSEPKGGDPTLYTEKELDEFKSTLYSNAALAHLQLKNWGHVRQDAKKALDFNKDNIKAWFRLAKAHQMLQDWEAAGDAIDAGLALDANNKDLLKLQTLLSKKIQQARTLRQRRQRQRAERMSNIKAIWKHVKEKNIQLGRIPLVASVSDNDDDDDAGDVDSDIQESRWHFHHPHSGILPKPNDNNNDTTTTTTWSWPCMFVYPSHSQSDFVEQISESDMIAIHMAQLYPELESDQDSTPIPWDYNNEFQYSKLAVYFEVHEHYKDKIIHPDSVQFLHDLKSTMKFHEATRVLLGDEGPEMLNVVRAMERKRLYTLQKQWKKQYGNLLANRPDSLPVVRVHPAMTLLDVLQDSRMVVPNFLVTFLVFPENHPAHEAYLKEHKCIGILQPKNNY